MSKYPIHYDLRFLFTRLSYVTASQASKQQLAFVNSAGNAIIKVDNTTNNLQINQDRNSVNIATKDYFAMGSVWVADMLHVPYGVSHRFFFFDWSTGISVFFTCGSPCPTLDALIRSSRLSAPYGPHSGLRHRDGPQVARSIRSRASTW